MDYTTRHETPLGTVLIASDGASLVGLWFEEQRHFATTLRDAVEEKDDLPFFDEGWTSISQEPSLTLCRRQSREGRTSRNVCGGGCQISHTGIPLPMARLPESWAAEVPKRWEVP